MGARIEPRPSRLGTAETADPERILELEVRREKHERLTRGQPKKTFRALLEEKMKSGHEDGSDTDSQDDEELDANDALLGLDPNQSPDLANRRSNRRSARVLIRG